LPLPPDSATIPIQRVPSWDVEGYRGTRQRTVVVRRPGHPTLVLGSTQHPSIVDWATAASTGVAVERRRSGGGAVYIEPRDPLWLDLWIPRDDVLWHEETGSAVAWVGEWWSAAITSLSTPGSPDPGVHDGRLRSSRWSPLVCFAGLGPGEVTVGGRKLVGIAQWRSRQGSLFHCAAYHRWEPAPLRELLRWPDGDGAQDEADLSDAAMGFGELGIGRVLLQSALLDTLPSPGRWATGIA
jgi:lipoate-protein ligase A